MATMMPAGDKSWLIHQSSLAVLPAQTSVASRRNGRRSEMFAFSVWDISKRSLKCRKILRHGKSGFTFHPKEGVLWICIALKNPSPAGFEPATFGSSCKHTNHYTTEATYVWYITFQLFIIVITVPYFLIDFIRRGNKTVHPCRKMYGIGKNPTSMTEILHRQN
jgi:hypothetical protein